MKLFKFIVLSLVVVSVLSACSPKEANAATHGKVDENASISPSASMASSLYYNNKSQGTVHRSSQQFVWESGSVSLIAAKLKSKEPGPDSNYLGEITVKNGDQEFRLTPKIKVHQINSVSLSGDQQFMAVSLFTGAGSQLMVINLAKGEAVDLNAELEAKTNRYVETISAYNWSPSNHQLAVAYGDTSLSNIAIYDVDQKSLSLVSSSTPLISTAHVLWQISGEVLDYVSESPSDHYKLYRYDLKASKAEEVVDLSRDEVNELNRLSPEYIQD